MSAGGNPFAYARRDPAAFDVMERAMLRFRHAVFVVPSGCENICNRYIYHGLEGIGYSDPNLSRFSIMLAASETLCTPTAILEQVYAYLRKLVPDPTKCSLPISKGTEKLRDLTQLLIRMQNQLEPGQEVLLCITNLHLLKELSPWYYLPFAAALTGPRLRTIFTTADREQGRILSELGIPVRSFPLRLKSSEQAGFFAGFVRSLELEGKHLERSAASALLVSGIFADGEQAAFVSTYLKEYILFEDLSETVETLLSLVGEGRSVYAAVFAIREQALLADPRFSPREKQTILELAGSVFHLLCYFDNSEELCCRCFTDGGRHSKLLYLEAFEWLRPFLTLRGGGFSIFNKDCRTELSPAFARCDTHKAEGMTDIIFSELNGTWSCLDDNYTLIRYLTETGQTGELTRLVTNNKWLEYVLGSDLHLLRAAWNGLRQHGLLHVKSIYEASGHINADLQLRASRPIYDLLMKMEHSVTGEDSIECFLDIPFAYSLDVERNFKKNWGVEDHSAVRMLKAKAADMPPHQLRAYPNSHAEQYGFCASAAAAMWELICSALLLQGALEPGDTENYLFYACRAGCLRQIADALHHRKALEKELSLFR